MMASIWESVLASHTNEDAIDSELDFLQSSPEEKSALEELVKHDFSLKNTGEWEEFQTDNSGIVFGLSEDHEALKLFDELEMIHDMEAFVCESATDELFAENPWSSRSRRHNRVSKKSEATIEAKVTRTGDSYATGTSVYGKVYIPVNVLAECGSRTRNVCGVPTIGDSIRIRARFQGYEDCRGKLMPWRAQYVV